MAVDKSQSPPWVRMVVIIIIVAFVGLSVPIVFLGNSGSNTQGTGDGTGTVPQASQFQAGIDAAVAAMNADPGNPDLIAQVGHRYYEWAASLYEAQRFTEAVPYWTTAVSYYDQTLAIRPDDDVVLGNKSFALFYAADPRAQDALNAFIASASDNPALAQQVQTAQQMLAELATVSTPATTTP